MNAGHSNADPAANQSRCLNKDDLREYAHNEHSRRPCVILFLVALLLSGFSGIINQIVWQRALKVFLGGSETLSSMTVVLVFMLGLGTGSMIAARRATRIKSPASKFACVEIALFLINLLIAFILSLDISDSVYSFQSFAVSLGVPLRALYVVGAVILLGLPCFLMGITMPLASEVCQRQLNCSESRMVGTLFLVNTAGAVIGALASGFYLVPYHGQLTALVVAASTNAVAALAAVIVVIWSRTFSNEHRAAEHVLSHTRNSYITNEEILGFITGFLALGYEMYLFRLNSLVWMPLPYTFSITLCGFLFFWSLGVYLAAKTKLDWIVVALIGGFVIASTPMLYSYHRWHDLSPAVGHTFGVLYFLPCLAFGFVYAALITANTGTPSTADRKIDAGQRTPSRWGRDVGRFAGLNTLGSCAGILFFTLIGYEFDQTYNAWLIAIGLLLVGFHSMSTHLTADPQSPWLFRCVQLLLIGVAIMVVTDARTHRYTTQANGNRSYFGRDGVVEITPDGMMMWDGMEHSYLASDGVHLGDNNWLMAAVPVLCHSGQSIDDVLVIGLGCGVTASTLSLMDSVNQIDVYDINHTLKPFLKDYHEDTLDVLSNPRINLIWQDARSGLALNAKKYDIITQQPLYLMQAGSSILLSREYMQLVQSRLKPGGVFCIYSNSFGNESQNLVVRQTVRSVFKYCESFKNEYMLVASDKPIDINGSSWEYKFQQEGQFFAQIRLYESLVLRAGSKSTYSPLIDLHDSYPIQWHVTDDVVSDDHPIVEYPDVVKRLLPIQQQRRAPVAN